MFLRIISRYRYHKNANMLHYYCRACLIFLFANLVACSSDSVNRFAYNTAANYQCTENEKHHPARDIQQDAFQQHTLCPGNTKLNGVDYEGYTKTREAILNEQN
ncbi:hypothetical protein TDB9533_03385 [Thalassocella blandensis]|nr:hypothetical protein TDB9533_03385 [Thalassocella blandensis]